MAEVLDFLVKVITIQAVYGLLITVVVYGTVGQINSSDIADFQAQKNVVDINKSTELITSQLRAQTGVPIIDVVALAIFTGNLVIDLVFNTIFAFPSMISLIIHVLANYMNLPGQITTAVVFVGTALAIIAYAILALSMLLGIRSQGTVR